MKMVLILFILKKYYLLFHWEKLAIQKIESPKVIITEKKLIIPKFFYYYTLDIIKKKLDHTIWFCTMLFHFKGLPGCSDGKESACNAGDLGRSPEEGNGYPLWYPCLENSMDRGCSPWGHKELNMTEWQTLSPFAFTWSRGGGDSGYLESEGAKCWTLSGLQQPLRSALHDPNP